MKKVLFNIVEYARKISVLIFIVNFHITEINRKYGVETVLRLNVLNSFKLQMETINIMQNQYIPVTSG